MSSFINADQVKSLARAAANYGASYLVTHGIITSGSTEVFAGVIVGLAALVWGHFTHSDATA